MSVMIVTTAKTAELIGILFGLWTRVGQKNHVLGGGQDPLCKETILRRSTVKYR